MLTRGGETAPKLMPQNPLTILYDGWPLVREPVSPAALHLLAILACLPEEVQPVVALPDAPPAWLQGLTTHVRPAADTAPGRLGWEQRQLPRIAWEQNAHLMHLSTLTSPLFGRRIGVVSPGVFEDGESYPERGFAGRLLASSRRGGLTRARAVFWPEDLPAPNLSAQLARQPRLARLPQVVHPAFQAMGESSNIGPNGSENEGPALLALNLPETYILYHGLGEAAQLDHLLKAWSWAAGAIGGYYPLLLLGLGAAGMQLLSRLAAEYDVGESVRALPGVTPDLIPALYRSCSALFHPAPVTAWGGAVQHALASGKPIAGSESELMDALVGPAAYLAPAGDARALGAALLTVIVEEQVAERLSAAARQRAAGWQSGRFGESLLEAYYGLVERI